LSNGVGSSYQVPGIAQSFNTIAGAQYTFNVDYAGQLGLTAANTQIGVYMDGQLLGTYRTWQGSEKQDGKGSRGVSIGVTAPKAEKYTVAAARPAPRSPAMWTKSMVGVTSSTRMRAQARMAPCA
jgi:hypothetical protein